MIECSDIGTTRGGYYQAFRSLHLSGFQADVFEGLSILAQRPVNLLEL